MVNQRSSLPNEPIRAECLCIGAPSSLYTQHAPDDEADDEAE